MRYFLNEFPFDIRNIYKVNLTQANNDSIIRWMALVRRQGGNNAALRNAWEIEINAMLAAKMSFTLCLEWPFRIYFGKSSFEKRPYASLRGKVDFWGLLESNI